MFRKIGDWFRNFMMGRYGQDRLGTVLFAVGLGAMFVSMIFGRFLWASAFSFLSWVLFLWCIFRMYSKNIEARSRENRAFTNFVAHLKDKNHRYFRCPQCRQTVRVPRGRGRINIRCPKCNRQFIKKT